ncbi:uncharacterized protein LOC112588229 [Harpegnathos saltator]|uniref:uncharacterized protein LOC112588229 n=1 Tax=Harpegnathos saltator TaxID=610380 RepID=UPI000DBEDDD3|nr:uncharacterized protein LOC112588229 [Harpegnathos saltator]
MTHGRVIKIPHNEIDYSSDTIVVDLCGTEILIEIPKTIQEQVKNVANLQSCWERNTVFNHLLSQEEMDCYNQHCPMKDISNGTNPAAHGDNDNESYVADNNFESTDNSENLRGPAPVPEKVKKRHGKTAEYIQQCTLAIEKFSSELKNERQFLKDMQLQMIEEYRIRKINEDFVKASQEQWAIRNAQRDERNVLLKEIVHKIN